MSGTAIVTGANSGIGFETVRGLAGRGWRVVMACRDVEKGEAARARLERPDAAEVRPLDLADLKSVRAFAAGLGDGPLDLLVANAGVMALPFGRTADGFERQLGTNHLGHFVLTGLLLPRLAAAPRSRVVVVASKAAERPVAFDPARDFEADAGGYGRWAWYAKSKLANLLFAAELKRRLRANAMPAPAVIAAHPGAAATDLFGKAAGNPLASALSKVTVALVAQSAARGAVPLLHAALAPSAKDGDYYGPDGLTGWRGRRAALASWPKAARDAGLAARLWAVSERLGGVAYP